MSKDILGPVQNWGHLCRSKNRLVSVSVAKRSPLNDCFAAEAAARFSVGLYRWIVFFNIRTYAKETS
jgi:hypothetical protein